MKKSLIILVSALIISSLFVVAALEEEKRPRRGGRGGKDDDNEPAWNYNHGGKDWGHKFPTCKRRTQNPVNLLPMTMLYDTKLKIHWHERAIGTMKYENHAYTLPGKFCTINVVDVDRKQLTYHSTKLEVHEKAEHTIRNKHFDVEVQIYLQLDPQDSGKTNYPTAIVSMLYKVNKVVQNNAFFEKFDFIEKLNQQVTIFPKIDFEAYFGPSYDYYTFHGSLTRPPCSENVNWFVIDKVFDITGPQHDQIAKKFSHNRDFAPGYQGNNRDLQDLNGRLVRHSTTHTRMNLVKKSITISQQQRGHHQKLEKSTSHSQESKKHHEQHKHQKITHN